MGEFSKEINQPVRDWWVKGHPA